MGGSSKKVTVGYKYLLGIHMILCKGPIDYVRKIICQDRTAWAGNLPGGTISLDNKNFYGGESKEGGIKGEIDVEFGALTQNPNSYLTTQLGADIPAYRQLVSIIFKDFYLGNNPYLKPWAFKCQRIHTRKEGVTQWYDAKSEIQIQSGDTEDWEKKEPWVSELNSHSVTDGVTGTFDSIEEWKSNIDNLTGKDWKIIGRETNNTLTVLDRTSDFLDYPYDPLVDQGSLIIHYNWKTASNIQRGASTNPFDVVQVYVSKKEHFYPSLSGFNYVFAQYVIDTFGVNFYQWHYWQGFSNYGMVIFQPAGSSAPAGYDQLLNDESGSSPMSLSIGDTDAYMFYDKTITVTRLGLIRGDMNPAHIIREALTDPDFGLGYPDADIDDTSFMACADTLYTEEFGLSFLYEKQTPIEEFIQDVTRHIDGICFIDRATGKFKLKLIRYDYTPASLIILDESNIIQLEKFASKSQSELINSVVVNFTDDENEKTASVKVSDTAATAFQGVEVNAFMDYYGITSHSLASRVAARDLKILSANLITLTIRANLDAKVLEVGDVFKFSWTDLNLSEVIMRVSSIKYGNGLDNSIKIEAVQDVFSLGTIVYTGQQETEWTDVSTDPLPVEERVIFEVPYYDLVGQLGQTAIDSALTENPDLVYLGASGKNPGGGTINFDLAVNEGSGYLTNGPIDFCPYAELAAPISLPAASGILTVAYTASTDLDLITFGQYCVIGAEVFKLVAIDGSNLILNRAVLDSIPTTHSSGDSIFFVDSFYGSDEKEYAGGESLDVKFLSKTFSDQLTLSEADTDTIVVKNRAFRPYPPADLKINSEYWKSISQDDEILILTYKHRDRIQETDTLHDWFESDIGPETGATYEFLFYDEDNNLFSTITGITTNNYTYSDEYDDFNTPVLDHSGIYVTETVYVAPSGALSHYKCDSVAGAILTDEQAFLNGTIVGGITAVTGQFVNAISLNGTVSQYVQLFGLLSNPTELSVSCWLDANHDSTQGMFFSHRNTTQPLIQFSVDSKNILVQLRASTGALVSFSSTGDNLTAGSGFHHVVCIFRATGLSEIWIDGVQKNTSSNTFGGNFTADKTLLSGFINNSGTVPISNHYSGEIDQLRVYTRALNSTEIFLAYHEGQNSNPAVGNRLSSPIRFKLHSKRDGYESYREYDQSVLRVGYGYRYGEYYGGF